MFVITNRNLCREDLPQRIEKIVQGKPQGIILREKDMGEEDFEILAKKCIEICNQYGIPFGINQNIGAAKRLRVPWVHLSVKDFMEQEITAKESFKVIGVSVHSVSEAIEMEKLGASYLIAGHIYPTKCKKDIPARGISFLQEVCERVSVPVLAIGGMHPDRVSEVLEAGAEDVCVMSEMMECEKPKEQAAAYKKAFFAAHMHKNEERVFKLVK